MAKVHLTLPQLVECVNTDVKFYCDTNIHLEVAPICSLTAVWKFDLRMNKGSFIPFRDDFPTALSKEEPTLL